MIDFITTPKVPPLSKDAVIGWGLIGASGIARTWVARAIAAQSDSKLVSVVSGDAQRSVAFAAEFEIPQATTSLAELLANPSVDAVYVSTRNGSHQQQVLAAARAGKHVLCEKPLALSLQDAIDMVRCCGAAGVIMGTNHHLRTAATVIAMRGIVQAGGIGVPLAARAAWCEYLPEDLQTWRTHDNEGGGVVFDLTVHTVDALRFVLGAEPIEVFAMTASSLVGRNNVEDHSQSVIRFSTGLIAQTHEGYAFKHYKTALEIHGTDGSLYGQEIMDERPSGRAIVRRGSAEEELIVTPVNPYEGAIRLFNAAIKGAGSPAATGWDGVRSLATALAVRQSAETHTAVAISAFDEV
jgi:1,5-anhydro-D-fructose reductase (1,5-anhydro-D-mannitol-forming)